MDLIELFNKRREERRKRKDDMERADKCRNAIMTNVCPKHCKNCAYFRGLDK